MAYTIKIKKKMLEIKMDSIKSFLDIRYPHAIDRALCQKIMDATKYMAALQKIRIENHTSIGPIILPDDRGDFVYKWRDAMRQRLCT